MIPCILLHLRPMLNQKFEMDPFLQIKLKDCDAHSLHYGWDYVAQSPVKTTGIKSVFLWEYWRYPKLFPLKRM